MRRWFNKNSGNIPPLNGIPVIGSVGDDGEITFNTESSKELIAKIPGARARSIKKQRDKKLKIVDSTVEQYDEDEQNDES